MITKEQVKQARLNAGLNQTQASALAHRNMRQWRNIETGASVVDQAVAELFIAKLEVPPALKQAIEAIKTIQKHSKISTIEIAVLDKAISQIEKAGSYL